MVDHTLWDTTDPNFPNGTASSSDEAFFALDYLSLLQPLLPETNVIVAGSARQGQTFVDLSLSSFSNEGTGVVVAVGENVLGFIGSEKGSSFSAPQVAGLASFLWLLSNDLRTNRPVTDTRDAILKNTRPTGAGETLDAYATVLSLDAPAPLIPANAPVRLALLDITNDQKFDEDDVFIFLSHFLDANGKPVEPSARDYSRFDLNGDGFTGGSKTEAFDLDRAGSAQYGRAIYGSATQQIEGKSISFDENNVTDMQVLCYYAYSPLYTGDVAVRSVLPGACAGPVVKIDPQTVTLTTNRTQQFSAEVTGTNDPRVNWKATGGTIDNAGLFTAGSATGTFTVRAISVVDSTAFDEATVTIGSASILVSLSIQTGITPGVIQGTISSTTASVQISSPIGDVPGFIAKLSPLLAGITEIGSVAVNLDESVDLTLNLGVPVGGLGVGGNGCASHVNLTLGDVRVDPAISLSPFARVSVSGCVKSTVTVGDVVGQVSFFTNVADIKFKARNVGTVTVFGALFIGCISFGCGTNQSSTINIQAASISFLSIANTTNCTIGINGPVTNPTPMQFNLVGNSNLTLNGTLTVGDVIGVLIESNTFTAPPQMSIGDETVLRNFGTTNVGLVSIVGNTGLLLSNISMGSIAGELIIQSNHGFSDDDARAFQLATNPAGGVIIGFNTP